MGCGSLSLDPKICPKVAAIFNVKENFIKSTPKGWNTLPYGCFFTIKHQFDTSNDIKLDSYTPFFNFNSNPNAVKNPVDMVYSLCYLGILIPISLNDALKHKNSLHMETMIIYTSVLFKITEVTKYVGYKYTFGERKAITDSNGDPRVEEKLCKRKRYHEKGADNIYRKDATASKNFDRFPGCDPGKKCCQPIKG